MIDDGDVRILHGDALEHLRQAAARRAITTQQRRPLKPHVKPFVALLRGAAADPNRSHQAASS